MSTTEPQTTAGESSQKGEPLLVVKNLKKYFPIKKGILFDRPEHPYTEALLGSLPKIDDHDPRNDRLATIPGRPPDLLTPPDGCRFAARCKYAGMDSCAAEPPQLREIRTGHWVRSQHPASERSAEPVGAR